MKTFVAVFAKKLENTNTCNVVKWLCTKIFFDILNEVKAGVLLHYVTKSSDIMYIFKIGKPSFNGIPSNEYDIKGWGYDMCVT